MSIACGQSTWGAGRGGQDNDDKDDKTPKSTLEKKDPLGEDDITTQIGVEKSLIKNRLLETPPLEEESEIDLSDTFLGHLNAHEAPLGEAEQEKEETPAPLLALQEDAQEDLQETPAPKAAEATRKESATHTCGPMRKNRRMIRVTQPLQGEREQNARTAPYPYAPYAAHAKRRASQKPKATKVQNMLGFTLTLPYQETTPLPHVSTHIVGHYGHLGQLAGMAPQLSEPPFDFQISSSALATSLNVAPQGPDVVDAFQISSSALATSFDDGSQEPEQEPVVEIHSSALATFEDGELIDSAESLFGATSESILASLSSSQLTRDETDESESGELQPLAASDEGEDQSAWDALFITPTAQTTPSAPAKEPAYSWLTAHEALGLLQREVLHLRETLQGVQNAFTGVSATSSASHSAPGQYTTPFGETISLRPQYGKTQMQRPVIAPPQPAPKPTAMRTAFSQRVVAFKDIHWPSTGFLRELPFAGGKAVPLYEDCHYTVYLGAARKTLSGRELHALGRKTCRHLHISAVYASIPVMTPMGTRFNHVPLWEGPAPKSTAAYAFPSEHPVLSTFFKVIEKDTFPMLTTVSFPAGQVGVVTPHALYFVPPKAQIAYNLTTHSGKLVSKRIHKSAKRFAHVSRRGHHPKEVAWIKNRKKTIYTAH
ncbi:MAG: hypothetical protein C0514_06550 [Candidatus Puniceispirillum sp.]|nr:hypothetical protein [Candidatus Puniceispirillum sp.]